MNKRPLRALALFSLVALTLSGCGADSDTDTQTDPTESDLTIVASTNVWGDVAAAVAGDLASVTSLITGSAQDPHEFEASAQDRLALEKAGLVIKNGGGYDPFMDTLLASGGGEAGVLDAVVVSGYEAGEGFNEHVWYDLPTVDRVAAAVSQELSRLDPDNAATYQANYEAFAGELSEVAASATALKATAAGRGVAITEPVPLYLLEAAGLVNLTPGAFSEAVEDGDDVPPRVLLETLDLFSGDGIALLAYNAQTANATTEQVRTAAEAAAVPVVDFAETLPEGQTYIEWQQGNVDRLAAALEGTVGG
ncbi:MAG: zinc ABC transporter substrate-binding protein [Bifidobacteriaceae bacterium]|nr:zinc ABC transporter substrate-binding protein [Bifidobacteriaceae bacterium]